MFLVRIDVLKELSASIISVTRIVGLGTTANVVPSSPIFVALMVEALSSLKRPFLQDLYGVTSQKTPFFKSSLHFHLLQRISER
jgi:hypothetical protein